MITAATASDAMVTRPSRRYCAREYRTTRISPIRPAMSPLCSWVDPRVAEMVSWLCTVKLIGRAPNLSWSARAFEVSWSKEPVICGLPSVITARVRGAEMTLPSSTMANWFCAPSRPLRRVVTSAKARVPVPSKTMFTAHSPVVAPLCVVTCPLVASEMFSPLTSTGPRMYLTLPSVSQVIRG